MELVGWLVGWLVWHLQRDQFFQEKLDVSAITNI